MSVIVEGDPKSLQENFQVRFGLTSVVTSPTLFWHFKAISSTTSDIYILHQYRHSYGPDPENSHTSLVSTLRIYRPATPDGVYNTDPPGYYCGCITTYDPRIYYEFGAHIYYTYMIWLYVPKHILLTLYEHLILPSSADHIRTCDA